LPLEACEQRGPTRQDGHVGIHPQAEPGLHYLGIAVPVGRLLPKQMHGLAELAERYGRSELRLTVWQNLLLPYIANEDLAAVTACIRTLGFDYGADPLRTGVVACTGNAGCKYAATNTKAQALELV